jgi:prophage regulatory protein
MTANQMLRPDDVINRTGLSRVTIWRKVRDGNFPRPIELGPNAIGWPTDVIDTWLENRPRRTYGAEDVGVA